MATQTMDPETVAAVPIGARGVRWHLAVRQGTAGPEYTVFVDGQLVTHGHPTGEGALAEAQQILSGAAATQTPAQATTGSSPTARRTPAAGEEPVVAAGD